MRSNRVRNGVMSVFMALLGVTVIGMVIKSFIPSVGEAFVIESEFSITAHTDISSENSASPEAGASSEADVININTATRRELQKLSGIGEVTAQAVIDYRNEHGLFESVDELINVKGIGEKTLEKIRGNVTV